MNKVICLVIVVFCTFSVAKLEKPVYSVNSVGGEDVCATGSCNSVCSSLNWMGGTCNEGYCFCWKNMISIEKKKIASLKSLGVMSMSLTCDPSSCDSRCRGLGWAGGVCYLGSCWCYR